MAFAQKTNEQEKDVKTILDNAGKCIGNPWDQKYIDEMIETATSYGKRSENERDAFKKTFLEVIERQEYRPILRYYNKATQKPIHEFIKEIEKRREQERIRDVENDAQNVFIAVSDFLSKNKTKHEIKQRVEAVQKDYLEDGSKKDYRAQVREKIRGLLSSQNPTILRHYDYANRKFSQGGYYRSDAFIEYLDEQKKEYLEFVGNPDQKLFEALKRGDIGYFVRYGIVSDPSARTQTNLPDRVYQEVVKRIYEDLKTDKTFVQAANIALLKAARGSGIATTLQNFEKEKPKEYTEKLMEIIAIFCTKQLAEGQRNAKDALKRLEDFFGKEDLTKPVTGNERKFFNLVVPNYYTYVNRQMPGSLPDSVELSESYELAKLPRPSDIRVKAQADLPKPMISASIIAYNMLQIKDLDKTLKLLLTEKKGGVETNLIINESRNIEDLTEKERIRTVELIIQMLKQNTDKGVEYLGAYWSRFKEVEITVDGYFDVQKEGRAIKIIQEALASKAAENDGNNTLAKTLKEIGAYPVPQTGTFDMKTAKALIVRIMLVDEKLNSERIAELQEPEFKKRETERRAERLIEQMGGTP